MLLFARIIVIFVAGCVDVITVDAYNDRSGGNNEDVIKEDCSVCGVSKNRYTPLIEGGSAVKGGFVYPWMVSFRATEDSNNCAGAIIDNFHILTAAHCVKYIGTGESAYEQIYFQTSSPERMRRGSPIDKIIIHPKFSLIDTKSGVQIAKYDIALVKLKRKIKCDAYRNPICLPDANFKLPPSAESVIAGWAPPSIDETVSKPLLTHGTLKNFNFAKCIKAIPETKEIKDHMLCQGGTKQTICYGDSGGPLMYKINQKYYAVGIASSETNTSCPSSSPVIFTNVIKFIDWIEEKRKTSDNFLTSGKEC